MEELGETTGEKPITPPPSYSTVVDERSHQYGFVTPYPPASAPYPVTPYPPASPPRPLTLDHTESIHLMPMPMPMPMPVPMPTSASMPPPMPMPMPGSRVTYKLHLDADEPRENTSTSYGIAEPFRTTEHSDNSSSSDDNRALSICVLEVNRESSERDQTVHVLPQAQKTSEDESSACCGVTVFCLIVFGIVAVISIVGKSVPYRIY